MVIFFKSYNLSVSFFKGIIQVLLLSLKAPGLVTYTFNSITQEVDADAGGSLLVQGLPGLQRESRTDKVAQRNPVLKKERKEKGRKEKKKRKTDRKKEIRKK